jgi:hypothetical protein
MSALEANLAEHPFCTWTENEDDAWETSCNHIFEVNDGTPLENEMQFCPFCGKLIEEVEMK